MLDQRHRTAMFETLENRRLLAGDVKATLVGGDLMIRGDDASNGIEIRRIDHNTVRVQGVTVADSPTAINGRANGSVQFDVLDDVVCYLYGGADDRLTVQGLERTQPATVRGDLLVYGGDGRDTIRLNYVSVLGDARFSLDDGNDRLTSRYLYVGGDLSIYGAASARSNDKTIDIRGNNYVAGDTEISLGSGNDVVQISRFTTNRLDVRLGDGDDELTVDYVHAEGGEFHGGAGSDRIVIGPADFARFPGVAGFDRLA
jgi:hypothetical protein